MKRFFIPALFFILSILLIGENTGSKKRTAMKGIELLKTPLELIDSLKAELAEAIDDTTKVNIINEVSIRNSEFDLDSSDLYAKVAFELSKTLKWDKGIAQGYLNLGFNKFLRYEIDSAKIYYEKAILLAQNIKNVEILGKSQIGVASTFSKKGNYDSAKQWLSISRNTYLKAKDDYGISDVDYNYGRVLARENKYDSAGIYFEKKIKYLEGKNDLLELCSTISNIGILFQSLSNQTKALEYFERALNISKKIGDSYQIFSSLLSIGNTYCYQSNYNKGLEYFEECQIYAEEKGEKLNLALIYTAIAQVHQKLSNYSKSLEYLEKSIKISIEIGNKHKLLNAYVSMGVLNWRLRNYQNALEYFEKSMALAEENGDKQLILYIYNNMAGVYGNSNNDLKALEYSNKALKIAEELNDNSSISGILGSMGTIYQHLGNYPKSLENYNKALELAEKLGKKEGKYLIQGNIGILYLIMAQDSTIEDPKIVKEHITKSIEYQKMAVNGFEKSGGNDHVRSFLSRISTAYELLGDYFNAFEYFKKYVTAKDSINSSDIFKKIAELEAKKDLEIKEKENELLKQTAVLKESELARRNQELSNLSNKQEIQKLELDKRNLDISSKNNELTLLSKDKELQTVTIKQKEAEQAKSEKEIDLLNKDKQYQGVVRNSLFGGVGLLSSLALVLFLFFWRKKRDNKKLAEKNIQITEQKEIIEQEQEKSDKLLLNVLPATIAIRLKNGETAIADHFDEASVVFIDIVDFTKSSVGVDPKQVVEVLNELYTKLDTIGQKHGLEKIKTIGDCYMAAAGVPQPNQDHAKMAAKFAIESMKTIQDYDTGGGKLINFRCGIDCGPIVAGVIGEKKFIYDIWGDAVNTASRMEEYGQQGKIQVTERFKEKLKIDNGELKIEFEERGDIEIKGKGMMKTYFLEKV